MRSNCETVDIARHMNHDSAMTHMAMAIANEFLKRALADGVSLTNMHVQKLVYIAHGWNLAVNNEPLIDEPFLAWDYGPVARSLFDAMRPYGAGRIPRLLRKGDDTPNIQSDDGDTVFANLTGREADAIDQIWREFKNFKAFQLSELTHKPGSPWSSAYRKGQNVLGPVVS